MWVKNFIRIFIVCFRMMDNCLVFVIKEMNSLRCCFCKEIKNLVLIIINLFILLIVCLMKFEIGRLMYMYYCIRLGFICRYVLFVFSFCIRMNFIKILIMRYGFFV